jgi:protein-L-isoaspartate(D-aspartate) O-methyltransferase
MDTLNKAFEKIDRIDFVPDYQKSSASLDVPLPIGYGQTISQPYTVKHMLQWLDARVGDIVLDVGSGSGWTTALLSFIIGPKGKVYAVERIPELLKFSKVNCMKYGIKNTQFFNANEKVYGLPEKSPYNRILVSAAAKDLPDELLKQLIIGGKMVIPVNNDILEISKISKNKINTIKHPGFIFVPLI